MSLYCSWLRGSSPPQSALFSLTLLPELSLESATLTLVMAFSVSVQPVPLESNDDGVVCVAGTRVTLDTVVATFLTGATAEEIAQQYPSLQLADVYAVISYYLRHTEEVGKYLSERRKRAAEVKRENEARFDPSGVRERLLARQR